MKLIKLLGYAGLVPFVLLPVLYSQQLWPGSGQVLQLYHLYSALILGFMAGVLWPVLSPSLYTGADRHSGKVSSDTMALVAVSFPVLSIIALALSPEYFLLLQTLLFVLLRLAEYFTTVNQHYSAAYRSLRNQLTLIVSASHLLMYWLLFGQSHMSANVVLL